MQVEAISIMKKLTENLIQQRLKTCTTDLDKVQQINVTGRELEDVSLLKKMTGVEILSLSVNQITSLADFQNCKNLKELYLRSNKITNLNEIFYLKNLPKLELLMLTQNPCTSDPSYRMTVIKNLKNLSELDGVAVTPEERRQAQKIGKEISLEETNVPNESNTLEESQAQSSTLNSATEEVLCNSTESKVFRESQLLNDDRINVKEESERAVKQLPYEKKNWREKPTQVKNETKSKPILVSEVTTCKFCGNDSSHSLRIIPKNYNILSAILNLVKELDYSGLQIINAEVGSRLSAFEVDFIYHPKP